MYLEVRPYNESKSKLVHISIEHKQKIELFKSILTDVGIGAKTNVGFGQLE